MPPIAYQYTASDKKIHPDRRDVFFRSILLSSDSRLFVRGFCPAPIAKLIKFDLALNLLLIFIGVVITPFANRAAKRDQPVSVFNFSHGDDDTTNSERRQIRLESKNRKLGSPVIL